MPSETVWEEKLHMDTRPSGTRKDQVERKQSRNQVQETDKIEGSTKTQVKEDGHDNIQTTTTNATTDVDDIADTTAKRSHYLESANRFEARRGRRSLLRRSTFPDW